MQAVGSVDIILGIVESWRRIVALRSLRWSWSKLDLVEALLHFCFNFDLGGDGSLFEPLMEDDVREGKSLEGLEGEHAWYKVFEGFAERALSMVSLMQAPELAIVAAANVLVVWVFLCSFLERERSSLHDEEDDADSEQVYDLTLEGYAQVNFRSHVALRANESGALEARRASPIDGVGEAEVGQF